MRVVVIGAGRMGGIRAQDLATDPRVADVLIANRTPERAKDLAARIDATPIDWSAIAEVEADAYVMALATDAHSDLLGELLVRGVPVLCEKPIALTIADTSRICELARASGAQLQIGFQRRFDAGIAQAQQAVASGQLGTLYDIVLASRDHTPPDRIFLPGSGGIFRDLHVHDLDLVAWVSGSPIATVQAASAIRGEGDYADFDDADITRIIARTESGVLASISGARHDARGHDVRMEVFGSSDSLSAGITSRTPITTLDDPDLGIDTDPYAGFIDRFREAFRAETTSFIDVIGGAANPCPPESALDSLRAAIACEISVRTGAVVTVADVLDE